MQSGGRPRWNTRRGPEAGEASEFGARYTDAAEQAIGRIEGGHFAGIPLDYAALDTRYPYQVGVLQARVEEILESRLAELGGELRRDWRLTGFEEDDEGVTVHGPQMLRARYLVGCDGGRSTVRRLLGIGFRGTDATRWNTVADIVLGPGTEQPPAGWASMGQARGRSQRPSLRTSDYLRRASALRLADDERREPVLRRGGRRIGHDHAVGPGGARIGSACG